MKDKEFEKFYEKYMSSPASTKNIYFFGMANLGTTMAAFGILNESAYAAIIGILLLTLSLSWPLKIFFKLISKTIK